LKVVEGEKKQLFPSLKSSGFQWRFLAILSCFGWCLEMPLSLKLKSAIWVLVGTPFAGSVLENKKVLSTCFSIVALAGEFGRL
jgi:hypothetical protein